MRNFSDWLDAYCEYANDGVCPASYIKWSGLSILAAVMERKVWCVDGGKRAYPNLFVLLVGPPGGGKSRTIAKARPLFNGLQHKIKGPTRDLKVIEGISTQAAVCEAMQIHSKEDDGSKYSSMYCVGPEGSDSFLKNHADDFRSTACAMYDCEDSYQKHLKTKTYFIEKPVMNMLVGATYDFLKTVVDQNSVLGGLASRFTYVMDEAVIPEESSLGDDGQPLNMEIIDKLVADLVEIYNLRGQFAFTPEALKLHQKWWTAYRKEIKETDSERLRSLLVRKPLMLNKACILYAAASGSELLITEDHMEAAIESVNETTKGLTKVISSAMMGNRTTQDALNQIILQSLKKNEGSISMKVMKQKIITFGADLSKYETTLKMLTESGMVIVEGSQVKLLVDPDRYL